jgi:hypothetical protein
MSMTKFVVARRRGKVEHTGQGAAVEPLLSLGFLCVSMVLLSVFWVPWRYHVKVQLKQVKDGLFGT